MLYVTSYTCLSEIILNDTYCTKNKMTFYKYDTQSKLFLNLVLRLIPVIDISRLIRICISVITFGYLITSRVYACTVGLSAREYVFHVMYTRNWARFCIRDIPLIPLSLIFPNGINRLMPRHNYPPWHWSFLFVFASFLFVWNRRVIE